MAGKRMTVAEKRHEQFALTYVLNGFNATQAYKDVYGTPKKPVDDPTARTNAWRLLTKADMAARIKELRIEHHDRLMAGYEETLQEVSSLAMFDPADMFDPETGRLLDITKMPPAARKMVQEINFTLEDHDEDYVRRMVQVKYGKDKRAYLDMLMKHYGAYEEHQRAGATQIAVIQYCDSDARL